VKRALVVYSADEVDDEMSEIIPNLGKIMNKP